MANFLTVKLELISTSYHNLCSLTVTLPAWNMQQEQSLGLSLIKHCVIFAAELHKCAQIQDRNFSFIPKTITTIITVNTTSTALGACDPILAADTKPVPLNMHHHLFNLPSIRDINRLPLNLTGLLMVGFLTTSNHNSRIARLENNMAASRNDDVTKE